MFHRTGVSFAVAISAMVAAPSAWADEVTLKAYTSTESNLIYSQIFLEEFVAKVNEAGKGIVQINYIGGPEVTPADKSAQAIERGIVDISYGPAGYYNGVVPEGYALTASEKNAAQLRADGGFELLDQIWQDRINARILAWGISDTGYSLFFSEMPKIDEAHLDLSGMKIRSSGTYKPMIDALGGTPVSIPSPEFYTSLQRGLVVGSGWPDVGLIGSGTEDLFKYRIAPDFFRANHLILVNEDKWQSLSPEAQKILSDAGLAYETASVDRIATITEEETAALEAGGIETITLTGDALKEYEEKPRDALWRILGESSEHTDALRTAMTR